MRRENSSVSEIKHKSLGEILRRSRGGIFTHVMFLLVFPFKIPVVRGAE